MKRLIAILLAALLLCGAMFMSASAAGIDITDKFTDPAFRAAVYRHIGKTAPAPIYDTDVADILVLNLYGFDWDQRIKVGTIKSLAGLEYFTGLEILDCAVNDITALPALPAGLKQLGCGSNQISALPALPVGLTLLWCGENQLTVLPTLPSGLVSLSCSKNQLTALPTLPPGLEMLGCSTNQLTALPPLPASLTELWCGGNQLTSIDITGLQLTELACQWNYLASEADVIGYDGSFSFNFSPQKADKATLAALVEQARAIEKGNYNDDSWNRLQAAIFYAQAVLDNEYATRSEGDSRARRLQYAIDTLYEPVIVRRILSTRYEATLRNWILFIFFFGWIWMWII